MAKIPGVNDPIPGRPDDPLTWPGMAIKGRSTGFDSHLASDRNRRVAARCPASGRTTLDRTGSGHSAREAGTGPHAPLQPFEAVIRCPAIGEPQGARWGLEMLQPKNAWLGAAEFEREAGRESIMVSAHLLSLGHRARV